MKVLVFVLLLGLPLEVQQTINELKGRIENLEKQTMLILKSYKQSGVMITPPPTSYMEYGMGPPNYTYMEHGMRSPNNMPPMNFGTPPLIPPINYTPPPIHTPPDAMNTSIYCDSPISTAFEPSTTAALVDSVANTKESITAAATSNITTSCTATAPPITTITKVVVPTSVQYPIFKRWNTADVLLGATDKENTPLPPINHQELLNPTTVVDKYPKLLQHSKLPTLAVKLAVEAFFGPEVMSYCSFRGIGPNHALPQAEVKKLKDYLFKISSPGIVSSRCEFEIIWAKCVTSIGQKCKTLRNLRMAN